MKKLPKILLLLFVLGFISCSEDSVAPSDDIQNIIPQDKLNAMIQAGLTVHSGNNAQRMNGLIYFEPEVLFDNTNVKKENDRLARYLFAITRHEGKQDLRLTAGPNQTLGHRMIGDGQIWGSPNGNFTIYAKTEGVGQRGRKEYEIIYVLSGRREGNTIENFHYGYVVVRNDNVSFIEDEGTIVVTKRGLAEFSPSL